MSAAKKDPTPTPAEAAVGADVPLNDSARKKAQKPKKKQEKSKGGGITGLLVLLIVIFIAVAGLFAIVYFDLFGSNDLIISTVLKLDPDYVKYQDELVVLETKLAEVEAQKAKLDAEAERLKKEKAEIQETKTSANVVPVYRRQLNEDELAEMKSLGKIYSAMEPAVAARIMPELYSVRDMAAIIFYMNEDSAALVLTEMTSVLAAEITQELIVE